MSSTPIREALRLLEAVGLVVAEPHRGIRVADFTAADAAEVYDLRALLEGYATKLAVPNLTDEDVHQLDRLASSRRDALKRGDAPESARYNEEWHMGIYRGANKTAFLYEFVARLCNAFRGRPRAVPGRITGQSRTMPLSSTSPRDVLAGSISL
jgi:DNA-binding GntR family transcriptional regulator